MERLWYRASPTSPTSPRVKSDIKSEADEINVSVKYEPFSTPSPISNSR